MFMASLTVATFHLSNASKFHSAIESESPLSFSRPSLGELNADHVPSGAALKKAAEDYLKKIDVWSELNDKQRESVLNRVYNNAKTITVPEDVHKEGRT
ncbi:hypothetical protein [Roseateles amylovorans]|uniref:Uncharacterized protein n=1 Tax=Roseateles amylovorans TaxID=2978473 RepID=A0ABY6B5K3_9BURK|nr:hypothetical protein [Roseateles amylovorans]UXH80643.1 hypothetical protein N4261_12510 [Roseateles amylovorans]